LFSLLQAISAIMAASVSLKYTDIVSQFDGSGNFSEWLAKLEMVAKLQNVKNMESFLPLFLSGGAFQVFQGLSEEQKENYGEVRKSLMKAFAIDQFMAYEEVMCRRLGAGESVDVYLADLVRLLRIIHDHEDDELVKCAFVAGLPDDCKKQIRGACSMTEMTLGQIVVRARTLIKTDETCMVAKIDNEVPCYPRNVKRVMRCYGCGKDGHLSRKCPNKAGRKCYGCGSTEHLVGMCPSKINVRKNW
jgi:hypothetical protein